jgi:hypothetical protein
MRKHRKNMRFEIITMLLGCIIVSGFFSACNNHDNPPGPDQFKVVKYSPVDVARENPMHIFVHYMPWFEDKSTSADGTWGVHWTMANRNPDNMDTSGRREIASHFYPLIGPYASSNPDVIEYHLLLMKYAGIEGILIDWYGASDYNDYGSIRTNSEAMIVKLGEVGLKFAIVYEDRTISAALVQTRELDRIAAAQEDMIYIEDNYFSDPDYIHIDGKPLFMVFGPEEFHSSEEWSEIISAFSDEPVFLILNGKSLQTAPSSSGEYIWVDNTSLDSKYNTRGNFDYFMGGAYPGFLDYYQEGGWGNGFSWSIDFNGGETLRNNLQKAEDYSVDFLQLITWNDFGEGTMIEPTQEFEYSLLEQIQSFAGISYSREELEAIHTLFLLRKKNTTNSNFQSELDQCYYYFVSLQNQQAISLLDSLVSTLN